MDPEASLYASISICLHFHICIAIDIIAKQKLGKHYIPTLEDVLILQHYATIFINFHLQTSCKQILQMFCCRQKYAPFTVICYVKHLS